MEITINSTRDENFKITTVKFGEQHLATDGERSCIEPTPEKAVECVETLQKGDNPQDPAPVNSNAAPLENSREGHPFDPFGGTSWAGKRNDFN